MKKILAVISLIALFQESAQAQYGTYGEYASAKIQFPADASNGYARALFSGQILWNFNTDRWVFTRNAANNDGAAMLVEGNGHISFISFAGMGNSSRTMNDAEFKAGTKLYINNDGRVGIGTRSPSLGYLLSVSGKIISEGVRVNAVANWPDYVFLPTYKLRPLSEVELYIKQHKHLPEVPAAAEVAKDGIDLAEMNATLLKKVEELTLYLIEQDKQLKKQNETIKELQKEVEALQK
ncbi:MAG: hypothetical protein ACFB0B_17565 [Thermonemataceae bacterium]